MFKTKLFAGICAGASVITAAATALTLSISGPAETKALHQYSPNEQVVMSLEGAFNSMSTTADEITQFVNVISSNKTAANLGFTINYAEGYEELPTIYVMGAHKNDIYNAEGETIYPLQSDISTIIKEALEPCLKELEWIHILILFKEHS